MAKADTSFTLPTKKTGWPGAVAIYTTSRDIVKFNLGTILWLLLASILVTLAPELVEKNTDQYRALDVLSFFINAVFGVASTYAIIAGLRGKKLSLSEAIEKGLSFKTIQYIALSFVVLLASIVSILLLIVPFFFVLPRLALSPYYLLEHNLGVRDSLRASWTNNKGHEGKFWGIIGLTILMALAILVLVGLYFLIMYSAAMAVLYAYTYKKYIPAQS